MVNILDNLAGNYIERKIPLIKSDILNIVDIANDPMANLASHDIGNKKAVIIHWSTSASLDFAPRSIKKFWNGLVVLVEYPHPLTSHE